MDRTREKKTTPNQAKWTQAANQEQVFKQVHDFQGNISHFCKVQNLKSLFEEILAKLPHLYYKGMQGQRDRTESRQGTNMTLLLVGSSLAPAWQMFHILGIK